MKMVFFGSDDFAAANLEHLLKKKYSVSGCVTQPDRAKGRGLKISESPVKTAARKAGIPLLQPEDIKDKAFYDELAGFDADLFVVIAYGKFLPQAVLNTPKLYAVNVHASLLPKYRGAAPINWALINGEKTTGVTVMKISKKLDAGDILLQEKVTIEDNDTSQTLRKKLAEASLGALVKSLDLIQKGKAVFKKQKEKEATLAPKLTRATGAISWESPAQSIHNLVRGLKPWPGARTCFNNKQFKILKTAVVPAERGVSSPGEVLAVTKEGITVATGDNALLVMEVHPESSKMMPASSYAAGHNIKAGSRFVSLEG